MASLAAGALGVAILWKRAVSDPTNQVSPEGELIGTPIGTADPWIG